MRCATVMTLLVVYCLLAPTADANPAKSLPIGELASIFESTTALEASSDADAENTLRITEEWSYAGATYANFLACSNATYTRETREWLESLVGSSSEIRAFYNSVPDDKACFVVHTDTTSERSGIEFNSQLEQVEPLPVASTISTELVNYDVASLNMTLNAGAFKSALNLVVSVFPERLATQQYATDLMAGLVGFMNNHSTRLIDNCQITADAPLCCKHFMKYGVALNHTLFEAQECGFDQLAATVARSGTLYIDVENITSEFNACGLTMLLYLAVHPEIIFVEAEQPVNLTSNTGASSVVQAGDTTSTPLYDMGVTGAGQVVGISDTGVDEESCFFSDSSGSEVAESNVGGPYVADQSKRKVVMYIAFQDGDDCLSGHGSHCAGSIVGASTGGGSGDATGVAKDAKVAVMDISAQCGGLRLPNDMVGGFLQPLHTTGEARIHSASWGSATSRYTQSSFQFDQFIYDNDDHLVLIAAGNSGAQGASSVGSPATFKNGLAVGASCGANTDINGAVFFSSLGPTSDGRLKPDIMSPGVSILSAAGGTEGQTTCQATRKSGTSMATPVAAGAAALLRQYLMEGRLPGYSAFTPSAALLKAMMITSASDVVRRYGTNSCTGGSTDISFGPQATPNRFQGFGRLTLENVLPIGDSPGFATNVYDREAVASSQTKTYTITIDSGSTADLRITLCWTDPPPSAGAARILVHDLDLLVTDPTGVSFFPNGGTSADTINNVERVNIPNAQLTAGGEYTVTVTANPLAVSSTQEYALVINGGFSADRGSQGGGGGRAGSSGDATVDWIAAGVVISVFGIAAIGLVTFCFIKSRRAGGVPWNSIFARKSGNNISSSGAAIAAVPRQRGVTVEVELERPKGARTAV